jgi:hypothetical protein
MGFVENFVYVPMMPKSFGSLIMGISKSMLQEEERMLQETWIDLEYRWNLLCVTE